MDAKTVKMIQFMRTFAPTQEKFMTVEEIEALRAKGMVHNLIVDPTGETVPFIATSEESKIDLDEKTDTPQ